jgi:hypothetical protein
MRRNVDLNGVEKNVLVEELNWGEPIRHILLDEVDVILAADCVYFEVRPKVDPIPERPVYMTSTMPC